MQRIDRPLRLDNVLFVMVIVVSAAFAADAFLNQEREKTEIAQAQAWRQSSVAQWTGPCEAGSKESTRTSDANGSCSSAPPRLK